MRRTSHRSSLSIVAATPVTPEDGIALNAPSTATVPSGLGDAPVLVLRVEGPHERTSGWS
eukprot:31055-Pelagococcus_subviridis.AAC.9